MQGICFSQSQARYSVAYEPEVGKRLKEEDKKKGTLFRYLGKGQKTKDKRIFLCSWVPAVGNAANDEDYNVDGWLQRW